MRLLGLDLGSKTCGVAITDELLFTVRGLEVIRRKEETKLRKTLARIEEIVNEYSVEKIILGYPKNMDGTISERCLLSEEFAKHLKRRTGLSVILHDERLTTQEASEIMIVTGKKKKEREKEIDMVAAVVILKDYLHATEKESGENYVGV